MFDWPEHNQTSPTNISCNTILFLPVISIVYGPPAFVGANCNIHLPSLSVVALYVLLLKRTLTFSSFDAHPQTFILASRCNTMLSLINCGSFTCAKDDIVIIDIMQHITALVKILIGA